MVVVGATGDSAKVEQRALLCHVALSGDKAGGERVWCGAAMEFEKAVAPPQTREEELFGDPLEVHWRKVVFGLCGVAKVYRRNFSPVIVSTPEQREQWLKEVAEGSGWGGGGILPAPLKTKPLRWSAANTTAEDSTLLSREGRHLLPRLNVPDYDLAIPGG